MLSDLLAVVLALASSPLVIWLALVAVLVLAGMQGTTLARRAAMARHPSAGHRPEEPYDWQRHGL